MRLLVDNPVSPQIVAPMSAAGHDIVHVRDLGQASADDRTILDLARQEDRVVVTQDTDFGALLAASHAVKPSVVLLRHSDAQPANHVRLLLASLPLVEAALLHGAIVVISEKGLRVRPLPIV